MVLAAAFYCDLSNLVVVKYKLDYEDNCDILQSHLLPFATDILAKRFAFQHDVASTVSSYYNIALRKTVDVNILS